MPAFEKHYKLIWVKLESFSFRDKFFPNLDKIDTKNINAYTESLFTESRDEQGRQNFLRGDKRLNEIKECEIVDFSDENGTLKKIKDLIKN